MCGRHVAATQTKTLLGEGDTKYCANKLALINVIFNMICNLLCSLLSHCFALSKYALAMRNLLQNNRNKAKEWYKSNSLPAFYIKQWNGQDNP